MRVHHGGRGGRIRRDPLPRPRRALHLLPFVAEEGLEETVVPGHRGGRPGAFQPAGDGVAAYSGAEAVPPAEALLLQRRALGLGADVRFERRTVGLAERVPAGDERDRLLVVHGHAPERLADVPGSGERVRVAVRPLRVHVDQAHLDGAEGFRQLTVAAVALVPEPRALRAPVDDLGLPHVLAPAAEAEGLEPHRLKRAVAREHHQVGPGDLPAVLLLDRPEQPARLVEARVVRPAVEGREALLARAGAAAAVLDAVRARAVPRHPDEQWPVVAVVGRPPVLRRRHHRLDVPLQGLEVDGLELLGVVEVLAHGVGHGRVLLELPQVQLIRPPVSVRPAVSQMCDRTLALLGHVVLPLAAVRLPGTGVPSVMG